MKPIPVLVRLLPCALAAALVTPVAVHAPAVAAPRAATAALVPGAPTGEFDPTSAGWYSYRDQTSDGFHDTYLDLRSTHLPVDLEITTNGGYRVASVWQRNLTGRAWKVKRNLTASQYKNYWEDAKDDGFRLTEHETYVVNGTRKYAGIWVRNLEGYGWASKRGQSYGELGDTMTSYRSAGLMPIDIDVFRSDGKTRYSTVWVASQVANWKLVRNLSESGWASTFTDLAGPYRVLAFESLEVSDKQRYNGIYVTNDNGRGWAARRDMSKKSYINWWYRYRDLGYRPVGVTRYETDDGTRYSTVWRQNSNRPNWPDRANFDEMIDEALDDSPIDGVAVAVYDDGTPVYTRGFGYADQDDGWWMDSTHTGSLASISKAIAGVLTFRMIERGELEIDDTTRSWVPAMPAKHSHTVGQLVSNRGCVRHYDDDLDDPSGTFATALDAAEEIWDDPLVCDPDTDTEYHYSTHGYTLLGAALEAAGNDDVKDLVRKRLTTPYGLGTVGPQRFSGHQMSVYNSDGDEVNEPRNDWKVLGGGLDSNATDLARFGWKLMVGDILARTTLTDMWTEPDSTKNYAYGWITGTDAGYDFVSKDGLGKGCTTYLLLYPTLGISIAVLGNGRGDNGFASGLAHELGLELLPVVP